MRGSPTPSETASRMPPLTRSHTLCFTRPKPNTRNQRDSALEGESVCACQCPSMSSEVVVLFRPDPDPMMGAQGAESCLKILSALLPEADQPESPLRP